MRSKLLFTVSFIFALISTTVSAQQRTGPILTGNNVAVVSTGYGKIRGYVDDGIYAFKGIPYAKAERFMPPQSPDKWEDVRQYTIYGPQAMQNSSSTWGGQGDYNFGFQFNREPMDEKNCFILNVWSKGINDGKKRPVWVWIHGGGYAAGSANQLPFFDGCSMAKREFIYKIIYFWLRLKSFYLSIHNTLHVIFDLDVIIHDLLRPYFSYLRDTLKSSASTT